MAHCDVDSFAGGTNWEGGSYDPEHHIIYVFSTGAIGSYGLVPPPSPGASDMEYIEGDARQGARGGRRPYRQASGAGSGRHTPRGARSRHRVVAKAGGGAA